MAVTLPPIHADPGIFVPSSEHLKQEGTQFTAHPPTPPSNDTSQTSSHSPHNEFSAPPYNDSVHTPQHQRTRRTRRAASVFPQPLQSEGLPSRPSFPPRKYTDPTPYTMPYSEQSVSPPIRQASKVNLDVEYDQFSEYEDLVAEGRPPTLSFVTTSSTVDSTASTPSIGPNYGTFNHPEYLDNKPNVHEPRIRMRTTTGRQNAYSSAESSMASGPYSYYGENNYSHSIPPPLPVIPVAYQHSDASAVGLGLSSDQSRNPSRPTSPISSPTGGFQHRPWHRDVSKHHLRTESSSSSISVPSMSTENDEVESTSGDAMAYQFNGYELSTRMTWDEEGDLTEARALEMVENGKQSVFDNERLEVLGGVDQLTEEVIHSLAGITHLLLPSIGNSLVNILPSLIAVLAPTLLVADLSNNDLTFLPDSLVDCQSLEELNVSHNPLKMLPIWFGGLTGLHVLQADGCSLMGMPSEMCQLRNLHTLCVRRNRLVSLPGWLCLLRQLETLRVDDNPFAKEWLPVVSPILSAGLSTRPAIPPRTASGSGRYLRPAVSNISFDSSLASRSTSEIAPSSASASTTFSQWLSPASEGQLNSIAEDIHPVSAPIENLQSRHYTESQAESSGSGTFRKGLRPMRSAGNLLSFRSVSGSTDSSADINRSTGLTASQSSSSSNSRYNTISAASSRRTSEAIPVDEGDQKGEKSEKQGKWGFLRKMSMHKLKGDKVERERSASISLSASASANLKLLPPPLKHQDSEPIPPKPLRPDIPASISARTVPTSRAMGMEDELSDFGSPVMRNNVVSERSISPLSQTFGNLPPPPPPPPKQNRGKRRSFLPIDPAIPILNVTIPRISPFMPSSETLNEISGPPGLPTIDSANTSQTLTPSSSLLQAVQSQTQPEAMEEAEAAYAQGLESIKSYLRDLFDLSRPVIEPYGGFEVLHNEPASTTNYGHSSVGSASPDKMRESVSHRRRRGLTIENSRCGSSLGGEASHDSVADFGKLTMEPETIVENLQGKKFKNDSRKRAKVIQEIYETERTYVRGLGELINIYIKPANQPVKPGHSETIIPSSERKVVFGAIESIYTIHRQNLLPSLEKVVKKLLEDGDDEEGHLSSDTAHAVGTVFRTYIAYMKQYSTYINNFDNALGRMNSWSAHSTPNTPSTSGNRSSPTVASIAGLSTGIAGGIASVSQLSTDALPQNQSNMNANQRKRVKGFLKKCREHPMHSQINLEAYLLLPVQRVPRYKLLLEDLAMCTPPQNPRDGDEESSASGNDALDDALNEIGSLASLMNEEKRDAESRLRLFQWQKKIQSKGPSPLVQPHRKLVLDGPLRLIRLIKKASTFIEVDTTLSQGEGDSGVDNDLTMKPTRTVIPVEYIKPEPMDMKMMLILCTDLMALVNKKTNESGWDGKVDLFNVLRMSTLKEPASIVHGDILRIVDNKSIYYFSGSSPTNVLEWCRAINSARKR